MSDHVPPAIRASDAERERTATRLGAATAEGRLGLAEAETRLATAYAATYRHELDALLADLPAEHDRGVEGRTPGSFPVRLRVHLALVVVLSVLLVTRWVVSGVPYFWPMGPMALLFGSLALHARHLGWSPRRPGRAGGERP